MAAKCPLSSLGGRRDLECQPWDQKQSLCQKKPPDSDVADEAQQSPILAGYDEEHFVTYLRLLDAAADDADWREMARVVLNIDPDREPARAHRTWETRLARARWMTTTGYRYLFRVRRAALTLQA